MKCPPSIMRLRILNNNRSVQLWLPLFPVYLILFIFALLLAPLVLIIGLLLWPWGWGRTLILIGPYLYRVICALRGLEVNIQKKDEQFLVFFK